MKDTRSRFGRGPWARGLVALGAVVGSWFAAGTKPFSDGADAACAAAFAAVALGVVVNRARAGATAVTVSAEPVSAEVAMWPWIVCVLLLLAWEVVTYAAGLGGRRHSFPTLSSLYDDVARWHGAKAFVFFLWIALGWRTFRRR